MTTKQMLISGQTGPDSGLEFIMGVWGDPKYYLGGLGSLLIILLTGCQLNAMTQGCSAPGASGVGVGEGAGTCGVRNQSLLYTVIIVLSSCPITMHI